MSEAGNRLLSYLERIERCQADIREIRAAIADIKTEAKSAGFDLKVMAQMLRERQMSADQRAEWEAQCQVYRAALGMLDGTPLGDAARKRFEPDFQPPPPPMDAAVPDGRPVAQSAPTAEDIEAARAEGRAAFAAGLKITQNPYLFADARRAAWDEGWCAASGTDGMELPDAWRRSKPAKEDAEAPPPPEPTKAAPKKRRKAAGTAAAPRRRKKPDDDGAGAGMPA